MSADQSVLTSFFQKNCTDFLACNIRYSAFTEFFQRSLCTIQHLLTLFSGHHPLFSTHELYSAVIIHYSALTHFIQQSSYAIQHSHTLFSARHTLFSTHTLFFISQHYPKMPDHYSKLFNENRPTQRMLVCSRFLV